MASMTEGHPARLHGCQAVVGKPGHVTFPDVEPNTTAAHASSECMSRGHQQIDELLFNTWRGHLMGMFRAPASRSLSMYNYIHKARSLPSADLNSSCAALHGRHARAMTAGEYVASHAGLMVKMLSGQEDGFCGFLNYCSRTDSSEAFPPQTTHLDEPDHQHCVTGNDTELPNVAAAVERLDGFSFVGLEEEWSLSVCLFHVMLGGECFAIEGEVTRSGSETNAGISMQELESADPYDAALYHAVALRFRRDLQLHNVTAERCQSICPGLDPTSFRPPSGEARLTAEAHEPQGKEPASNQSFPHDGVVARNIASESDNSLIELFACQAALTNVLRSNFLEPVGRNGILLKQTATEGAVNRFLMFQDGKARSPTQILGTQNDTAKLTDCLTKGVDLAPAWGTVVDAVPRPNIVIVGIGDSGTRGVRSALGAIGLAESSNVLNKAGDDGETNVATLAIKPLLNASSGTISADGYRSSNPGAWNTAVWMEQIGALHVKKVAAPVTGQPWGFKSPREVYLLPVLTEAYSGANAFGPRTTFLVVARDLRDLCTGANQDQFKLFASLMGIGVSDTEASEDAASTHASLACFQFAAKVWRQVPPSLGGQATASGSTATSLSVVRIEDLVGAPASLAGGDARTNESKAVAERITYGIASRMGLEVVNMSKVSAQVAGLNQFVDEYGGGLGHQSAASRSSVVRLMANCTEVHDVMQALGYDPMEYARGQPRSAEVLTG